MGALWWLFDMKNQKQIVRMCKSCNCGHKHRAHTLQWLFDQCTSPLQYASAHTCGTSTTCVHMCKSDLPQHDAVRMYPNHNLKCHPPDETIQVAHTTRTDIGRKTHHHYTAS